MVPVDIKYIAKSLFTSSDGFYRIVRLSIGTILALWILVHATLNRVEPQEVGIVRNHITGKTWTQSAGWHFTPPWTWVTTVPTRPIRVEIPTSGRGYSAKLIQFKPDYVDEFLELEGWRLYWWYNRFSINIGQEESRGFKNIMLGYAYSNREYPFIEVLEEYTTE